MKIFKNANLIYQNGRAANRLYKRYFSATGGRITCMDCLLLVMTHINSCQLRVLLCSCVIKMLFLWHILNMFIYQGKKIKLNLEISLENLLLQVIQICKSPK